MGYTPLAIRVYASQLHTRPKRRRYNRLGSAHDFRGVLLWIDGVTYEHDVIIDRGAVRKRKKKPSKQFREEFGHTPVSVAEEIPWDCKRLVIGTGGGALPVMDRVKHEADQRKIKLSILPTAEAIKELKRHPHETNAILHVTC